MKRHREGVAMSDSKVWQQVEAIEESKLDDRDEREVNAAYMESVYNGTMIKWQYWVGQMPLLSAGECARLVCALDPDIFNELGHRPNKIDPADLCSKAEKIQRLAERQGRLTATPTEWLEWAKNQGIKVHDGFRMAVDEYVEAKSPAPPVAKEKLDAKAQRYQMCIDAGLSMPDNDYAELPTGIGMLAKRIGISKQAFSRSVKSHIARQKR